MYGARPESTARFKSRTVVSKSAAGAAVCAAAGATPQNWS
jgi:hypothetical protein